MKRHFFTFYCALQTLVLPLGELLALRWFVHEVLNLRIGWPLGITDADLLVPGLLAYFFLFFAADAVRSIEVRVNALALEFNLLLLMTCGFSAWIFGHWISTDWVGMPWFVGWILLVVSVAASALFSTVSARSFTHAGAAVLLLPTMVIASVRLISRNIPQLVWEPMQSASGRVLCSVAQGMGNAGCGLDLRDPDGLPYSAIQSGQFAFSIGRDLCGLDGVALFVALFAAGLVVERSRLRPFRALTWLLVGVLGMYLANLARVVAVLLTGRLGWPVSHQIPTDGVGWLWEISVAALILALAYRPGKEDEGRQLVSPLSPLAEN